MSAFAKPPVVSAVTMNVSGCESKPQSSSPWQGRLWRRAWLMVLACLLALMADGRAQNVSASAGQASLDIATGLFVQPVTLTNNGTVPATGIRIFVSGLPKGITFWNANGEESGVPFHLYAGTIAPGQSAVENLEFFDPTRQFNSNHQVSVQAAGPVTVNVAISTPADQASFATSPVTVTGTVTKGASVTVKGVAAQVTGGTWTASVPLHNGFNILNAVASIGNVRGRANRGVFLTSTPAEVTITFPADGARVTDQAVTVTGIINDIVPGTVSAGQATVTVNGRAATISNRCFIATDVPLVAGDNAITAVGTDTEGNRSTHIIHVTYLPPEGRAVIQLVSGNNQTGPIDTLLPLPLIVSLQGANGAAAAGVPVHFRIKSNDGALSSGAELARAVTALTGADGRAQVSWTLGGRSGAGSNVVQATAVGYTGKPIFSAIATGGPPARINVEANNNQTGNTGQQLQFPLIAVVTDAGHNRKAGVPVTFEVTAGGGYFNNLDTTITLNTDNDGKASAVLILGPGDGLDNNRVSANFAGNPGLPAVFVASGLQPGGDPANTAAVGVVLDNTDQPIPGVTLRILNTNLQTTSNAQGQFRISGVPVGVVYLWVDGSTATRPGTWPSMEYILKTVSGRDNDLGMPIYLLPLDLPNGLAVSPTTGGTLTLPDYPGFALEVAPGSVTFPNRSMEGLVSVTAVHADKVPMTPGFGQQPRFIITIQPANAIFDPPARMTLPNSDGLAPGEITEMYSFDHDLMMFVAIGTGHVSEDGSVVVSDPGVGVRKAGWHCGGNPQEVAAGITSTVTVDKNKLDMCKTGTGTVVATGNPTPPHTNPFEWRQDFTGIPAAERGSVTINQNTSGNTSTATITGDTEGKVKVQVRYRCKSAQWSSYKTVDVNVVKVEFIEAAACSGFDNTVDPRALMAPTGGSNTVKVKFTPPASAGSVTYESAADGTATVAPATGGGAEETLTVTGVAKGSTSIKVKISGTECGTLAVDVKDRLDKKIAIHAVTEENDDDQEEAVGTTGLAANTIVVSPGANGFRDTVAAAGDDVSGDDIVAGADGDVDTAANDTNIAPANTPAANALQTYLNTVWGKQANVFFTVTSNAGTVNYDINRSGSLADAPLDEANAIDAAVSSAAADYNVFYVKTLEVPQATTLIARGLTWIQDAHVNSTVNVSAHEVGHLLGIAYESNNNPDVMLSFGSNTNPCRVIKRDWDTVNP